MKFEYDAAKALLNREKHGVDLDEAKTMWENEAVILPARDTVERRFMIIGWINERLYSCIYTLRGTTVRLISCRRSSQEERKVYYEKVGG